MKILLLSLSVILAFSMACDVRLGKQVSVGGLSSGAYMAVQMHVAHSKDIRGAAVFAGGPYYCAQEDLTTALTTCMATGVGIDFDGIYNKMERWEDRGLIDKTRNLRKSKVFVFSGTSDIVVNPLVNMETVNFYNHFNATVESEFTIDAAHAMPTVNFGNVCNLTASPFIGK